MSRNNRNKAFKLNNIDERRALENLLSEEDVLGPERARRQQWEAGNFYGKPDRSVPVPPTRTFEEIAEPYLTAGSAIAGSVPAGVGGIASGLLNAATGGSDPMAAAAEAVGAIQDDLTYMPRTLRGAQDLQSALKWIEENPVLSALDKGQQFLGDRTLEVTGSPALATAAFMTPDLVDTAFGLGPARKAARGASKALSRLDPGTVGSAAGKMGGNQTGGIGGRNAAQLNPMVVRLADDMRKQGISKEDIWNVTGIRYDQPAFFDVDGNFGFEFDDSKAGYLYPARNYYDDLRALDGRTKEAKRLKELDKKGTGLTYTEKAERAGLRAQVGMLDDYGSMRANVTHPEIDKHYPSLLDETKYGEGYLSGAYGEFDPSAGKVTVNPQAHQFNEKNMRSTLLHEFSGHAVQDREKMPVGGNPGQFTREDNQLKGTIARIEQQQMAARIQMATATGKDYDKLEKHHVELDARKADIIEDLESRPSADARYYALTGEANARAIEKRRDMTMEERLARPFWLDFDERGQPSDQITKYR